MTGKNCRMHLKVVDEIKSIVKSKILAVYFPDAIVSINSHNGV